MGSTQQLYSLSWGEFSTSLSSTVQLLRGHGDLVDVTLTAGGKIFPAHKLVLGAASPLLMELLKSTKCQHPVVMLAGITAPDLEALLQFVYHGEVSVDPSQLPSLLQAAQCLDIQALSPNMLSIDKLTGSLLTADGRNMLSPFVSVRKRRRKIKTNGVKGQNAGEGDGQNGENKDNIQLNGVKENGITKKPPLISDLPVSCSICGVTLRQSRNLRRHMELIHMKSENGIRIPRKKSKKCEITAVDIPTIGDNNSELVRANGNGLVSIAGRMVNAGSSSSNGSGVDDQQQQQQQQGTQQQATTQQQSQQLNQQQHCSAAAPPPPPVYQVSTAGTLGCETALHPAVFSQAHMLTSPPTQHPVLQQQFAAVQHQQQFRQPTLYTEQRDQHT